jgi:hypothetical protein
MKSPCPDEEMLADYLEGRLAADERPGLEEHVSECAICLEGLVVAGSLFHKEDFLELDEVPPEVTEEAVLLLQSHHSRASHPWPERFMRSIRDLSARLSESLGLKAWSDLSLQPVRSPKGTRAENPVQLRTIFQDMDVEIDMEKSGQDKANIRVKLLDRKVSRKMVRVTLKQGEREIASYLPHGGRVLFEDIPYGHYTVTFSDDGMMFGTYSFEIKETGHGRG